MDNNVCVIVAAKRTPMGSMLGALSPLKAQELSAVANKAVLAEANLDPSELDEVILGCVLPAGLGQAPARQAAIKAGIPTSVGATTINKMCGSGMKAVMLAHNLILANAQKIILAGGMESMSNAPYLLPKARQGYRLGHGEIKDHMFLDGLEDAYDKGKLMGYFAEKTAEKYQFSRASQDEFAAESMKKALAAMASGAFKEEIAAVSIQDKNGTQIIDRDEGPDEKKLAKIPQLKPAFSADGTVTAANSSSISDGAASLILMPLSEAKKRNIQPLAQIVAQATFSQDPEWFTTAPVTAIQKVLTKAGWTINDVDLFEINEAFAVVTMAAIHDLKLNPQKVNIHGGACALGHPIGASGARILVTLIHALKSMHKKRGVAALCIGGGEATAIAIELF